MNTKINILFICVFFGFSVSLSSTSEQVKEKEGNGIVSKHGQLSVTGVSLVDKNNNPIALKGASLGWHNWWPRFFNEKTVTWLVNDWNCNVIRAAIGVDPDNAYLENPDFANECLDKVVQSAIENDIYVIIDWHSHKKYTAEAKEFFTRAANKYKDYPNIIYEIFNEPEQQSWEEVKAYSEELIKTIRAIDNKNIILVGSPHWDQDVHLAADNPITGYDNLMYTLHFYAATHKQYLRDRADYALNKGLPIFVSECAGMEATGDGPIDIEEWKLWIDWMDAKKISWAAWSIADKNETCSMIQSADSPVSDWGDEDLKEWGKIVRSTLKNP